MNGTAVRCLSLSKAYGSTVAVHDVSLTVSQGDIVAVLGPSGCGKTTLLRLIAGFEKPDAGSVEIHGRLVAGQGSFVPPEHRRVGMVFQHHALFPHLTVFENIAFGLKGRPAAEVDEQVHHLLALVGLADKRDRYPHELSGGESQRVALGRALAPRPLIVLMDEPFSNLDADRRARIRDEVRFILKQTETTVIFVTHDQEEALFMGDLLVVMKDGRLIQEGTPEGVFHGPANQFIAEFMGRAEFLPAVVTATGLETELGHLDQPVPGIPGDRLDVGFRADDVTFAADPSGKALILARFFQGALNVYRIRLASGRLVHSMQPHTVNHAPGTRVRAWFDPNHALPCFKNGVALEPSAGA